MGIFFVQFPELVSNLITFEIIFEALQSSAFQILVSFSLTKVKKSQILEIKPIYIYQTNTWREILSYQTLTQAISNG